MIDKETLKYLAFFILPFLGYLVGWMVTRRSDRNLDYKKLDNALITNARLLKSISKKQKAQLRQANKKVKDKK